MEKKIPKTPLPLIDTSQFKPEAVNMYTKVREAETRAIQDGVDKNLVAARTVGHFFLQLHARRHILGDVPFESILADVMSPPQDPRDDVHDVIFKLGELYKTGLIRACAFDWFPVSSNISVLL